MPAGPGPGSQSTTRRGGSEGMVKSAIKQPLKTGIDFEYARRDNTRDANLLPRPAFKSISAKAQVNRCSSNVNPM